MDPEIPPRIDESTFEAFERSIVDEATPLDDPSVEDVVTRYPKTVRHLRVVLASMRRGTEEATAQSLRIALGRVDHASGNGKPITHVGHVHLLQGGRVFGKQGLQRSAGLGKHSLRHLPRTNVARRMTAGLLGMAMCLIGIVGLWYFGRTSSAVRPPRVRYTTSVGQHSTVRLPDGSIMMLGPSTVATVSSQIVTVVGAAYFSVVPNATRALTVQTRNAVVHVLGTHFLVQQYSNDATSRVVVEDGRLSLSLANPPRRNIGRTTISARMMAFVTDSGVMVTSGIDPRVYTGWTQGTLIFDHTQVRDVVAELSRAYGAQIHVEDTTLARVEILAEVDIREQSLSKVLDVLGYMLDAHVERAGHALVLVRGRMKSDIPSVRGEAPRFPQPEKLYGR